MCQKQKKSVNFFKNAVILNTVAEYKFKFFFTLITTTLLSWTYLYSNVCYKPHTSVTASLATTNTMTIIFSTIV